MVLVKFIGKVFLPYLPWHSGYLGKCTGDCDTDSDCQGNLQCRQRYGKNALDPVPGCNGTGKKGIDYCY